VSPSTQKADAPEQIPPDDASIPVLTERLTLPPLELDTTLPPDMTLTIDTALPREPPRQAPAQRAVPPAAAPTAAPPAAASMIPPRPVAPTPASGADAVTAGTHWTRIEVELRSSILQAVADALPQEVDAIVRSRMNEAIDRLVEQLAAETRLALAASLRDIVDHAVRTELGRLRTLKR
jgi:hypothetical protein